jgi:adenine deaminase
MDVGLLQLNDPADFCIVNNLVDFKVGATYIDGNLVAQNGKTRINSIKEEIVNNFSCSEIGLEQLRVDAQSTNVQVICVEDGQLITTKEIAELTVIDGALVPNVAEDILKIAVVNRYEDAPPALGFVKNFGLKHGAIASCVAHDSHNIIAVGTNDKDLCEAINAIVREKGGVSLANGVEMSTVALPVAGIMSNLDGYEVAEAYEKLDLRSKELGVTLAAPYMTLSFCALLVIPKLKLSDKGLFDGEKFCFTSIYAD